MIEANGDENISSIAAHAYGQLSAVQLASGLREGRWTSVELTQHFINKIAELNPQINAVVGIEASAALDQAEKSDRRRAEGVPLSPLDGMPMTVKDAFRMQGYLSTYGFWMLSSYRPSTDCKVIAALRQCGVIFMGRTVVPTGSFDWNCVNQIHAECLNPFDASRTPGGSSGGAAAALALGMTPLELGSDFHGSLRYPAHCCGIYSLRTTDGWLPIADVGPEAFPATFKRIATCGPMAKNLVDLQLLLAALVEAFPLPKIAEPASATHRLRIAYSKEILGVKTDKATAELFDQMLNKLNAQDHELSEISPAFDWDELYQMMGVIGGYEFSSVFPRYLRHNWSKSIYARLVLQSRIGKGAFLTYFRRGMLASQSQYESALKCQQQIFAETEVFFSRYELWILPVAPSAAIPRKLCGKKIPTANGEVEYLRYLGSYLGPTATLGTPALATPIGHDQDGLPIAVQIHGPRFSDRRLVQLVGSISI